MGILDENFNPFIGEKFVRLLIILLQEWVRGALFLCYLLAHDAKGKRQSIELLRKLQSCLLVSIRIPIWHTECQEKFGSPNNRERRQIQLECEHFEFQTPIPGDDKQRTSVSTQKARNYEFSLVGPKCRVWGAVYDLLISTNLLPPCKRSHQCMHPWENMGPRGFRLPGSQAQNISGFRKVSGHCRCWPTTQPKIRLHTRFSNDIRVRDPTVFSQYHQSRTPRLRWDMICYPLHRHKRISYARNFFEYDIKKN